MHRRRPIAAVVGAAALVATLAVGCDPVPPRPVFRAVPTASGPDAAPGDGACATTAGTCSLEAAVDEANAEGRARITVAAGVHTAPALTITGDVQVAGEVATTPAGAEADATDVHLEVAAGANVNVTDLGLGSIAVGGALQTDRVALGPAASPPTPAAVLEVRDGGAVVVARTSIHGAEVPAVRNAGSLGLVFSNLWAHPHEGDPAPATLATTATGTTSLGATALLGLGTTPACAGTPPSSGGWNVAPDASCALTGPGDSSDVADDDAVPTPGAARTDAVPLGSLGCSTGPATTLGAVPALDGDGDGVAGCDTGAFERPTYVDQVLPMGSPYNHFGTGKLATGSQPELIYQSVNPACTSKVNGDRHQSLHHGPLDSNSVSLTSCPAVPTNQDHRATGYDVVVEAPEGRTDDIEVLLYDARYSSAGVGTCTVSYPVDWTGPESGTSTITVTAALTGPLQYQTRANGSTSTWSVTTTIVAGASAPPVARNRIRYKQATTTCPDPAIDSKRQSADESFTFTLLAPDDTPLDVEDDPTVPGCSRVFTATTPFDRTYLGTARWNELCTITPDMPAGRYAVRATNGAPGLLTADGSNQWGLVARYANAPGNGLCDGRTDPTCPRVYGRDAVSVYANSDDAVASFFLAEVDAAHAGRTVEVELWDPGEGGSSVSIMRPTGADTWTPAAFTWTATNENGTPYSASTGPVTSLDVTSNRFNGKLVRIRIPLDGYAPPAGNQWWKVRYTFGDGDRVVTDRTTWSARITG